MWCGDRRDTAAHRGGSHRRVLRLGQDRHREVQHPRLQPAVLRSGTAQSADGDREHLCPVPVPDVRRRPRPGATHARVHRRDVRGWDVEQIKSIVAETLHEIVDPLVFQEAADLIADHKLRGHDVVVISRPERRSSRDRGRARGVTQHREPDAHRRRTVCRRARVLLFRRGEGGGDERTRRSIRLRPDAQLCILGFVDGHPDAAGGRERARGQPPIGRCVGSPPKRVGRY